MENLIAKLKIPSPHHEVKIKADGFILCPLDSSVSALDDFQLVVEEAIHYAGDEYNVHTEHADGGTGKFGKVFFQQVKQV